MQKSWDVIVVGGGAAGLVAANACARQGAKTLVLEKMKKCALKVGISGKGRANVSCDLPIHEFISHFESGSRFLRSAFSRFFVSDTIKMFESLGVPCVIERGSRVFPKSGKAHDVRMALIRHGKNAGAIIQVNAGVEAISYSGNGFEVQLSNEILSCRFLILATGGKSYPRTGSTGDGYRFAQMLGHKIVPLSPALVELRCKGADFDALQNLTLKNVGVALKQGEKDIERLQGEAMFVKGGLGGPIPISFGRLVASGKGDGVEIDFKPALDHKQLDARLLRELVDPKRTFGQVLATLLPGQLIKEFAKAVKIPADKPAGQITKTERKRLRLLLKGWRFPVIGTAPIEDAIVTAGGILLTEVNQKTMESKIVPGLFLAGEVLDIDAQTGGFNLQAAFSTGFSAGYAAAEQLTK